MNTQFKRGVVEMLVLKVVKDQPRSSYDVIDTLSKRIDVNENTVYPILRRLTKQGYFETKTQASLVGAPRKVYSITGVGEQKLDAFLEEWAEFLEEVLTILGGDNHE